MYFMFIMYQINVRYIYWLLNILMLEYNFGIEL